MEEKYIICEASPEGIFTAVYDAYALRESHEHIHIQIGEEENYRLFAVYLHSIADSGKTEKVTRTLKNRLGEEAYLILWQAAASCEPDRGEAVYRTVVDGITAGHGRRTMENLRNPYVARCFALARRTANEAHHEIEFLRFGELEHGALYAVIRPENNVLPFIMPHFADRLSVENFVIRDEGRDLFGVHPAGQPWYLVSDPEEFTGENFVWSGGEERCRELFRLFCGTIGIQERENRELQRQMFPLRFRDHAVEFADSGTVREP